MTSYSVGDDRSLMHFIISDVIKTLTGHVNNESVSIFNRNKF